MSRVTDIVDNTRDIIADRNGDRWDDASIYRKFNSAVRAFVHDTECLKVTYFVELEDLVSVYDLRDYIIKFNRVQYLSKNVETKTHLEMDDIKPEWEDEIGDEVRYVIFDQLEKGLIKIFPKVEGATSVISYNQLYGGIIDIDIVDQLINYPSLEDISSSVPKFLQVYGVKKPETVTAATTDAEMEIPDIYDEAIQFYISGMCLRSDTDAQNRSFGAEQLQLFDSVVKEASKKEAISNNTLSIRHAAYRGGFQ